MTARIIDGAKLAKAKRQELKSDISKIVATGKRPPCLAVVLVGDDPASHIYVSGKEKACKSVGIESRPIRLATDTSREKLKEYMLALALDKNVDGILLQLPLPKHLNAIEMIECIPASKDVDGLTVASQGLLVKNLPGFVPCTPMGIMELLQSTNIDLQGALAVVIGRSVLVGASITRLLEHAKATTISIASNTRDPAKLTSQADIVVAAAGVKQLIDTSWIKHGAVVIDVGIHRNASGLCGDVNFDDVKKVASWITPVPGGVGPMTITALLQNCFKAWTTAT